MASCYGSNGLEGSNCRFDALDLKTQSQIIQILASPQSETIRCERAQEKDLPQMLALMNQVIEEGRSWPFLTKFDDIASFQAYFCSHDAFALLEGEEKVVGCFDCSKCLKILLHHAAFRTSKQISYMSCPDFR